MIKRNLSVGQKVYSLTFGFGKIESKIESPVRYLVRFRNGTTEEYYTSGKPSWGGSNVDLYLGKPLITTKKRVLKLRNDALKKGFLYGRKNPSPKDFTREQIIGMLPFEDRVKHAPYSIWIPNYEVKYWVHGQSEGTGTIAVNGITYHVSTTHNCNGHHESVKAIEQ